MTSPAVSFLTPVKNVGAYLDEAVASLQSLAFRDWELVIADDHSEDDTPARAARLAGDDPRIRVVTGSGRGIVAGLNAAYAVSTGGHLKFLDGDDVLSPGLAGRLPELLREDAAYHDACVADEKLRMINVLRMTDRFARLPYVSLISGGIVSPPRWAWIFSRRVAAGLFPMPDLPSLHEDYWIALVIKKTAARIVHFDDPLYFYRQRPGQVYGGLYNFAPGLVRMRAAAMNRILDAVEARSAFFGAGVPGFDEALASMKSYYRLMARPGASTREILGLKMPWSRRGKLWLILKSPRTAAFLSRFKSGRASRWLFRLK